MDVWTQSQNYRFLDIFWDISNKRKGKLGRKCLKRLLSFLGKIGTIGPDFSTFLPLPP